MAMKLRIPVGVFSVIQIVVGLCSIISQIITLHYVGTLDEVIHDIFYDSFIYFGVVGCGIWAGGFFVISGIVGVATSTVQKRALLTSTVILTAICVPLSIVAALISVFDAWVVVASCDSRCRNWPYFEIVLAASTVIALVGNCVLFILVSVQTCCLPRHNSAITQQIMTMNHHPTMVVTRENPIMYVNAYQPQQMDQNEIPGKQEMFKY